MEDEKNENNFGTSDFYLAAFLAAKGLKLNHVDRNDPRRFVFVFENVKHREKLVQDFLFGDAEVEPKSFVGAIKNLKNLLYLDGREGLWK